MIRLAISILFWNAMFAAAADPFAERVAPILKKHCAECHSGPKAEAELHLDVAGADFANDAKKWNSVLERVSDGSMPPKGKPKVPDTDRKIILETLALGLKGNGKAEGRALLRRLNRIEYQNTVRDLLGVDLELAELLPEDGSANGFDTVDLALDLSSTLMERYLEAADAALKAALEDSPSPKEVWNKRVNVAEAAAEHKKKFPTGQNLYGPARVESDHILVLNDHPIPRVVMERVPVAGRYQYRVNAAVNEHDRDNQIAMRVYSGVIGGAGRIALAGVYPVGREPTVIEFTERLEKNEALGFAASGVTRQYNLPDSYKGPGLKIYWVEVRGPLPEPRESRAKLLGTSNDTLKILGAFAARAFRRKVVAEEIAPFVSLVDAQLRAGANVDDAIRVGFKAILCSPKFLYLRNTPGKLTDHELACRLSYFFWSTMPDDALFDLAGKGKLNDPAELHNQVERMLNHPKAKAFTENFTGQWLNLRNIKATDPDAKLYPEFDPLLEYSMSRETQLYFEEILKRDRSALEFVASDWSILNNRMAVHYGIPGVQGQEFRKVQLPAGSHRGGVLTQASVLKVTANGTTTSPVLRGAWVLDRILGKPASPPPNDIPAIEPDVRGTITIREQLAKHRNQAACASCHARIDPPGFALENFDVIGGWRTNYRVTPSAKFKPTATYDSRGVYFAEGPKVTAGDELPDGRRFENIDGFKKLLLTDPDQIVRNLAQKLVVYSTGHGIEPSDRENIEKIVAGAKAKNWGFRTLIHEIVRSETFRNK